MRTLIVSEFVTLDGIMQAPGGADEDRDGGFEHGGVIHAEAFEPIGPENDPFGPVKKYVVSRTLERPIWRDTTIIRDDVVASIRALKATAGKAILTDGSSQLVHSLLEHDLVDELHLLVYPIALGKGKRVFSPSALNKFTLKAAKPYPTGVVGLHYARAS